MSNGWFGAMWKKNAVLSLSLLILACATTSSAQQKRETAAVVRWRSLIPKIENVLAGNMCPGQRLQIGIADAADLTGDGVSVALVDYCPGGAYTDWIIAMRLEAGQPVRARFRKNGELIPMEFASGSSVMHSVDVKLVPEKQAIYDFHNDTDGTGRLERCAVDAYVWNSKSKTFDWDTELTKQATRSRCHTS